MAAQSAIVGAWQAEQRGRHWDNGKHRAMVTSRKIALIALGLLLALLAGAAAAFLARRARIRAREAEAQRPHLPSLASDRPFADAAGGRPTVPAGPLSQQPAPAGQATQPPNGAGTEQFAQQPRANPDAEPKLVPPTLPERTPASKPQHPAAETTAPVPLGADALKLTPDPNGILVWEAEWANRLLGSWACLPMEGSSQGAALWSRDGSGRSIERPFRPWPGCLYDLGVADYLIDVPRAGAYRLLMRAWASDACGDTCWVTLDHGWARNFPPDVRKEDLQEETPIYGRWTWLGKMGVPFHLSAGPHRLRMEVREDGLAVDQIALAPEGAAIAEDAPALRASVLPGQGRWPADARLSAAARTTRDAEFFTPFDAAVAAETHMLFPDQAPAATLWLWLRLNVPEPHQLRLSLAAPGAAVLPQAQAAVRLDAASPLARLPLRVVYPASARRCGYEVRCTVDCPDFPGLRVEHRLKLIRPLDWRVLGPLDEAQQRAAAAALRSARAVDLARPVSAAMELPGWTRLDPSHYDFFGTILLDRALGQRESSAAFLAAPIHVERKGDYQALAGGDDTLHVRLSGARLLAQDICRPLSDALETYPLQLEAGDHWLVARVQQRIGHWEMQLEFQDQDGRPSQEVWGLEADAAGALRR